MQVRAACSFSKKAGEKEGTCHSLSGDTKLSGRIISDNGRVLRCWYDGDEETGRVLGLTAVVDSEAAGGFKEEDNDGLGGYASAGEASGAAVGMPRLTSRELLLLLLLRREENTSFRGENV